jgi:hypothetical protein
MKKTKKTPEKDKEPVKDTSPRVPQRDKIGFSLNIRGLDSSILLYTKIQKLYFYQVQPAPAKLSL